MVTLHDPTLRAHVTLHSEPTKAQFQETLHKCSSSWSLSRAPLSSLSQPPRSVAGDETTAPRLYLLARLQIPFQSTQIFFPPARSFFLACNHLVFSSLTGSSSLLATVEVASSSVASVGGELSSVVVAGGRLLSPPTYPHSIYAVSRFVSLFFIQRRWDTRDSCILAYPCVSLLEWQYGSFCRIHAL